MTIADYLPWGVTPDDIITLLAGIAAFVSVYAVWNGLINRDPLGKRIKQLGARRDELREVIAGPRRRQKPDTAKGMGFMRSVVDRLKLMKSSQAAKIADGLAQAGYRSKDSVVIYLFAKMVMPFVMAGAVVLVFYVFEIVELDSTTQALVGLGGVLLGAYSPDIYIRNIRSKRQAMLQKGLPDALDLLVICAEAGLTLDAALNRVARELGASWPELADEFSLAAIELGFLPDRRVALVNLKKRAGLPSIEGMVNTLMQSEKYGTPLAQSLRVLASEFRNERMMKAEEKAARLPAIMTIPLVMFILPALFIVLIGPAIVQAIDSFRGIGI